MGISSIIYDSWMRDTQNHKYSGLVSMMRGLDLSGKVLDIGIGTALFEDYLIGMGYRLDVTGIEIDGRMMSAAQKKGYEVTLGSAEQLPFGDDSFGFAMCIDTIHAVGDKEKAMREIARVLKPGKHALISWFCNAFTKEKTIARLEELTSGFDVVSKKIVGSADNEISVAFLIRNPEK